MPHSALTHPRDDLPLAGRELRVLPNLRRLREVLDRQERIPATEVVTLLRLASREDAHAVLNLPRDAYQYAMQLAFEDDGPDGFVAVAVSGATSLDAQGYHEHAIARLEQARLLLGKDGVQASIVAGFRAVYEATGGDVDGARRALQTVVPATSGEPRVDIQTSVATSRLILLDLDVDLDGESPFEVITSARSAGFEAHASGLMVQLISMQVAVRAIAVGTSVANDLLDLAISVEHRARQVDAEAALIALRQRGGTSEPSVGLSDEARTLFNAHAFWKLIVPQYWAASTRGMHSEALELHRVLVESYDWLPPGYRNSFSGLAAYHSALFDQGFEVDLPMPKTPTLLSVGNVLASAEAVAIGGTLSAAAEWLTWLEAELPAYVVTSLEWPACRRRVESLLHLRVGHREEAIEGLRGAIDCCEGCGDTIEAELARAQLAALTAESAAAEQAAARLRAVGIDAAPFAAAALRVSKRAALVGDEVLTVFEARVLRRLVQGMTHREIEDDLGLPPRAASRPLTTSYAKLGVNGRVQAVQAARERLIA